MKYLSQSFATIPENLAADEWLLDCVGESDAGCLRSWTPPDTAVILGRGNSVRKEAKLDACADDGIGVFRRTSGGGTVLLSPDCLCFSIVVPASGPFATFTAAETNTYILSKIETALNSLPSASVSTAGDTDLVVGNSKIAGSAQRRSRNGILFHGVILLTANLLTIGKYLHLPTRQPDYRQNRPHQEFLSNVPWSRADITTALRTAWAAGQERNEIDPAQLRLLTARHRNPDWIETVP
jgi:lipoate---protein ligase